jgi:hypothetical protein
VKIPVFLILLLTLPGCMQNIKPTVKSFNTSIPGVIQTRKAGETLFEKGTVKMLPGFLVQRDSNLPLMENLLFPPVKRGDIWACRGRLRNGDYVCADPELNREDIQTDSGKSLPYRLPQFIIGQRGEFRGLYFTASGYAALQNGDLLAGLFVPADAPLSGSFRQELIYIGKSDDIIKLIYREFAEDVTKPSFFQVYSFNIASLDIIQVKDVIIEILEATESAIRFVIKN